MSWSTAGASSCAGPRSPPWAPQIPRSTGARAAPSYATGGAARYVFWMGEQLCGSDGFMGALHPIGTLPGQPSGAFDWLDGTGIAFPGGAEVVPAGGTAPRRTGVPALLRGIAADGRRAVALTALGHALLTLDGGRSYRDVTADLGASPALEVRGDAIAAVLGDGRTRLVTASGAIVDGEARREPGRGSPPPPRRIPSRARRTSAPSSPPRAPACPSPTAASSSPSTASSAGSTSAPSA